MAKRNRNSPERQLVKAANKQVLNFCRSRLNIPASVRRSHVAYACAEAMGGVAKHPGSQYDIMWRFYERYQGIDGIAKQIDETGIAPLSKVTVVHVARPKTPPQTWRPVTTPMRIAAPVRKKPPVQPVAGAVHPASDEFLRSFEWRQLRMVVLKKRGARCECCGASPKDGIVIHVDHIKPRRRYPELALTESNLQILCEVCNHGKGSWDDTDWRADSQKSSESYESPVTGTGDGDGQIPIVRRARLVRRTQEGRADIDGRTRTH